MIKQNKTNMLSMFGADTVRINCADGLPQYRADGLPQCRADGLPQYRADGQPQYRAGGLTPYDNEERELLLPLVDSREPHNGEKWQYDCESDRGLTIRQKLILLWLIRVCKKRETRFLAFYSKVASVAGITRKAARVHVAALEKKNFIATSVIYRSGTKQAVGKRVFVTRYAPSIKKLYYKLSAFEKQRAREMKVKYNEKIELWKMGVL